MFRDSTNTAPLFSVFIAALIFSLSLARVAAAQGNTSLGTGALQKNTTGGFNTAIGVKALTSNLETFFAHCQGTRCWEIKAAVLASTLRGGRLFYLEFQWTRIQMQGS